MDCSFFDAKDLREIRPGSPPTGAPNAGARPEYHVFGGLEPRAWRARERDL